MTCIRCAGRTRIVRTVQAGPQATVRVRICLRCGSVFRTSETPVEQGARPGS